MYNHAVLHVRDVHDFGQRKARTLGPGKRVLADRLFTCG